MSLETQEMVKRNDQTTKIDAGILRMAKIVAAFRDVSLAEYLTEALREIVARDLAESMRRQAGADPAKPAKPPKKGGGN